MIIMNAGLAPDDGELMARLRQKDPAALEALYDRYAARMLGLALRIVRQRAAAEEVVQEAFFRVWQRAASFDPQRGDCFNWLITIVRNGSLDYLRRQQARPVESDLEEEAWPSDPQPTVPETAEVRERRRQVQRALAELPFEQRQVIELSYFAGLSRREIALRLNVPEGTIHTRARLGLLKLREALIEV